MKFALVIASAALVFYTSLGSVASGGATQGATVTNLSLPVLEVRPLRDAGGMSSLTGRDAKQNEQFAQALQKYLADAGKGRFTPVYRAKSSGQPAFTLEGDLSRIEPIGGKGGQYLCTLRLFAEGKPRRLVNQWSGMANNLRYLYANFENVPGVDAQGLMGAIGKQVAVSIGSSGGDSDGGQAEAINRLVAQAERRKRIKTQIVVSRDTNAASVARLTSGQDFMLRVTSQDNGEVYALWLRQSAVEALFVPEEGNEVTVGPKDPAIVPLEGSLKVPTVSKPSPMTLVVLVRRRATRPDNAGVRGGNTAVKSVPTMGQGNPDPKTPVGIPQQPQDARATITPSHGTVSTENPVRILTSGVLTPKPEPVDPVLARLLKMAGSDPADNWSAQRIRVEVVTR